ncbi:ABC transporter permease [Nocardia pseudobrasiliensis]|uniref:Phospholipid/cholesterol/gamma-HCH transport system permease protein n=1 Tax=Nocardia pseudobrasiliensis TaxID=45979 RepID=A0A370ICN5_9NOCA|nr:ABC transporter permease [Nocardia pseudobrasiliensis]RDI68370.1 phospholipid/cholesterol/gamma-HCH transport system permease protein [Nocardia pseudobrasiliensis]
MSTSAPSRYRPFPRVSRTVDRALRPMSAGLAEVGQVVVFIAHTVWLLPVTVRHYRSQTMRMLNNLAWGRGSLIVDGGVVSTMLIMGLAVGAIVSIEAFAGLNLIGFGALSGVVGGMANIREMAPIVAGVGFAAQAGCRMTAEIGAMRISEEIDAIESLGVRSIPFVVGTRLLGGLLCVAPAYLATLLLSFLTCRTIVTVLHAQAAGTYNHYFEQFLDPVDVGFSLVKALLFCAVATLIHCYFGFFAAGGPAGVGIASGRAIRASLVAIILLDLILTVLLWGVTPEFVFVG